MRIALLTQYYKPETGAPQNRLYEMIDGLKRLGNEVCVVSAMPNYPTGSIFKEYRGKFSCKEESDGIEIKRYWLYASNSKKALPRIFSMFSFSFTALFSLGYLRRFKPDILMVESPPLTLGITAWWLARRLHAGLVSNISDLWPLSAKELGAVSGDGFVYRQLERMERFIYRKSALCMGQSAEIVDYMNRHGAVKTYLFRNGVDPSRFDKVEPAPQPLSAQAVSNPVRIVYAGLLGFAQGINDLCRNIDFKSLGAEFHIYGAGGEQTALEEYLQQNPDKGIFYHGKVSRDEIPAILLQADATLIPLVKNIFGAVPSKIYESMAAGVPVLFSGEGEGERIVREYNLGWCAKAKDYEAIKNNIKNLVQNPGDIAVKKENCRRCARDNFNRPKQIEALDKFFKENL